MALCPGLLAQRAPLRSPIDSRRLVVLTHSRNPRINVLQDEGALNGTARVRGLGLRFKPSVEQSAELEQLLEDLQNPSLPRYHAWLTPEEFGDRFGLTSRDLARVTEWIAA